MEEVMNGSLAYSELLEELVHAPLNSFEHQLARVSQHVYHGEHRTRSRLVARAIRELVNEPDGAHTCLHAIVALHPRGATESRTRLFEWILVTLLGAARNDPPPLPREQLVLVVDVFLELVCEGARVFDRVLFGNAAERFKKRHHACARELVVLTWCFAAAVGSEDKTVRPCVTGAQLATTVQQLGVRTFDLFREVIRGYGGPFYDANSAAAATSEAEVAILERALSASLESDSDYRARLEQQRIQHNFAQALAAQAARTHSAASAAATDTAYSSFYEDDAFC
jgi:hypothetical protein